VFKDFPLQNHQQAPKAHQAAHCAGEQGKYWQMHDLIFANQSRMDVPNLKQHAVSLGINKDAFDTCLDTDKYATSIAADFKYGEQIGVNSTPTMYINGRPVVGAQPFEQFKAVIDEELARGK